MAPWSFRYLLPLFAFLCIGKLLEFHRATMFVYLEEMVEETFTITANDELPADIQSTAQPTHDTTRSTKNSIGEQLGRAVSPSQLLKTGNQTDPHFSNIEFLDLYDWELTSLLNISIDNGDGGNQRKRGKMKDPSCKPPSGIPKGCCVGTLGHSEQAILQRGLCGNKSLELYHSLRDSVLRQHLPPSTIGTTKCDLCRIIDLCKEHNITFGIYGDSMTRQMMESFECGLLRRGYAIEKPIVEKSYTKYIISSPQWPDATVTMHSYIQYKVLDDMSKAVAPGNHPDINAIMTSFGLHSSLAATHPRNLPTNYYQCLARLFRHLRTFSSGSACSNSSITQTSRNKSKFKLLLYREASAQHFDAEGGDYFRAVGKKKNGTLSKLLCVPFQWGPTARWREPPLQNFSTAAGLDYDNHLVLEQLERYEYDNISHMSLPYSQKSTLPSMSTKQINDKFVMLPFFDFTSALHDFHPSNEDCTHFCYVPYLWWPLWRSLRTSMEEGLKLG